MTDRAKAKVKRRIYDVVRRLRRYLDIPRTLGSEMRNVW